MAISLLAGCRSNEKVELVTDPAEYVSTLVGSLSEHSFSTGNTYPATALPWGMNFWTPVTGRMGDAFTEGNAWHYTWSVFHDVEGLREAMGGTEAFTGMLDSVFVVPPVYDDSYYGYRIHEITEMQVADMGNYAHGNQPAQHMLYLYDWTDEPWKGQKHIREVMDRLYSARPDGYCGDEDNGQTSAWYVFSALGFYPVCPASDIYAMGTPYFRKAIVHLENGKRIILDADGNSADKPYVKSLKINGLKHAENFIKYNDLICGALLEFKMSDCHK